MKKTICVILAAVLLVALGGCSQAGELAGTWTGTVNMTERAKSALSGMEATVGDVALSDIELTVQLQCGEDGTYTASVDQASLDAAFDAMLADIRTSVEKLYEAQIGQLGTTVDEMLALAGTSMDAIMADLQKSLEDAGVKEQLAKPFTGSGSFTAKGGRLTLEGLLTCEFTVEDTTLTLQKPFANVDTLTLTKR